LKGDCEAESPYGEASQKSIQNYVSLLHLASACFTLAIGFGVSVDGINSTSRYFSMFIRSLTPEAVLEIVAKVRAGKHRQDVAAQYGVCVSCIHHIMAGRLWSRTTGLETKSRVPAKPRAKLAEADVLAILRRLRAGESQKDIASSYRLSSSTICDIANGGAWTHVQRP
jgi:uncharacterized protein (DUF433 family)